MHHISLVAQHHAFVRFVLIFTALVAGVLLAIAADKLAGGALRIYRHRGQAVTARQERARQLGCRPSQVKHVERLVNRSRGEW
jgi:hypothetical protein